ncbi:hypothetical protein L3X38_017795 [Prunus dulcis]|uniref:RNase H type-1 domain-containing protein n=1 Tax=Prunus dulcis TaxID=3755 RepID=A0AAD4W9K8_PRUDU|nr:hypothetical protein L3X38_017795 [Prunus dulcis]
MGSRQIQIFSDSQLVVHQVNQAFTAKDISMTAYLQHARHLLTNFDTHLISQVPRSENSHADALARLASALELSASLGQARRVRYSSARYLIINNSLYKGGFSLPYLRCLTLEEGNYVLREIHEGICGNHSGARSLAHKAIRQGYFRPSLYTDVQAFT